MRPGWSSNATASAPAGFTATGGGDWHRKCIVIRYTDLGSRGEEHKVDGEPFDIETGGEHAYLVHVHDPDEQITIELRISEEAARDLDAPTTHEAQVAAATVRYLLSRQEAFDLPGELDLEDIIAAYADFTDVIRHEVAALSRSDRSPT